MGTTFRGEVLFNMINSHAVQIQLTEQPLLGLIDYCDAFQRPKSLFLQLYFNSLGELQLTGAK